MSIIVRQDDQIFLFIKGAETSIWPHLSPLNDPQLKSTTEQHSLAFAQQGYRSLLVAYRQLSLNTFEDWFERYKVVANSLVNREINRAVIDVSPLAFGARNRCVRSRF